MLSLPYGNIQKRILRLVFIAGWKTDKWIYGCFCNEKKTFVCTVVTEYKSIYKVALSTDSKVKVPNVFGFGKNGYWKKLCSLKLHELF